MGMLSTMRIPARRVCMDYSWSMHGLCIDYALTMHCLCIDYAWGMHGLCMVVV